MASNSILLKSGTVLFHSSESKDDHVAPLLETDVLIEGNLVKEIRKDLKPLKGTEVVDCVGKIISPGVGIWFTSLILTLPQVHSMSSSNIQRRRGHRIPCLIRSLSNMIANEQQFINTHHHLWQTQLKGRHAEHTLIDYMHTGLGANLMSLVFTAKQVQGIWRPSDLQLLTSFGANSAVAWNLLTQAQPRSLTTIMPPTHQLMQSLLFLPLHLQVYAASSVT